MSLLCEASVILCDKNKAFVYTSNEELFILIQKFVLEYCYIYCGKRRILKRNIQQILLLYKYALRNFTSAFIQVFICPLNSGNYKLYHVYCSLLYLP